MRKPIIFLLVVLLGGMMMLSGCGLPIPKKTSLPKTTDNSDSEEDLSKMQERIKDIEAYAKQYMDKKYKDEFEIRIASTPGFSESHYRCTAVNIDTRESCKVNVFYIEEYDLYSANDTYFSSFVEDDLTEWMKKIVDKSFNEYKIFYESTSTIYPDEFTADTSLEEVLGALRSKENLCTLSFTIVINLSEAKKYNIEEELMKIMKQRSDIRGAIHIDVFEDEVYDKINTEIDETNYWANMNIKKMAIHARWRLIFNCLM